MMLDSLTPNVSIALPAASGWPEAAHILDEMDVLALTAAQAADRPLLVRGEPGTGKTQLARAVAIQCQCHLIPVVINGSMELEDLFWRYDAVARLADAQAIDPGLDSDGRAEQIDQRRYVVPGPLWWAFDWSSAQEHCETWSRHQTIHLPAVGQHRPDAIVLLIDEIDKADEDLPNGLLEAFGQGSFRNPWVQGGHISRSNIPLLTLITTNEERELPRAFLRRCFVHKLEYLDTDPSQPFNTWMIQRARAHMTFDQCSDEVLGRAADLIRQDRAKTQYGEIRPGLAEYLDLLKAVSTLSPDDHDAQLAAVNELSTFVLSKHGSVY